MSTGHMPLFTLLGKVDFWGFLHCNGDMLHWWDLAWWSHVHRLLTKSHAHCRGPKTV